MGAASSILATAAMRPIIIAQIGCQPSLIICVMFSDVNLHYVTGDLSTLSFLGRRPQCRIYKHDHEINAGKGPGRYLLCLSFSAFQKKKTEKNNTRMWADAQLDDRWRPALFNAAKFG